MSSHFRRFAAALCRAQHLERHPFAGTGSSEGVGPHGPVEEYTPYSMHSCCIEEYTIP